MKTPILARFCHLPVRTALELRAHKSSEWIREFKLINKELNNIVQEIDSAIYESIPAVISKIQRSELLKCKRLIKNLKPIGTTELIILQRHPQIRNDVITRYLNLQQQWVRINSLRNSVYEADVRDLWKVLLDLASDPLFQSGVMLSSEPLYLRLVDALNDKPIDSKTRRQFTISLTKYLVRASLKTTPYSTFAGVSRTEVGQTDNSQWEMPIKRDVYLNPNIAYRLWNFERIDSKNLQNARLILNPNSIVADSTLLALTGALEFNTDGVHTHEKIVRLSPIPRTINDLVLMLQQKSLTRTEIEAQNPDYTPLVNVLLANGILIEETRPNALDQDFLNYTTLAVPVKNWLERLDGVDGPQRFAALKELEEACHLALDGKSSTTSLYPPVLEDMYATAPIPIPSMPSALVNSLSSLAAISYIFDPTYPARRTQVEFFKLHYSEGNPVPLLEFLQKWQAFTSQESQDTDPHARATQRLMRYNPLHNEKIGSLHAVHQQIERSLREVIRTQSPLDLTEFTTSVDPQQNYSWDIMGHLIPTSDDNGLQFVINHIYDGHGHMFSRFIKGLGLSHDGASRETVADIYGYFGFPADRRVFMTEELIVAPGWSLPGNSPSTEIAVVDLEVGLNPNTDTLYLKHVPSDKEIRPRYLGFMMPFFLPPITRFLTLFDSSASPLSVVDMFLNDFISESEEQDAIICVPRIMFCPEIVFGRRTWIVPKSQFPAIGPHIGVGDMMSLLDWAASNGLDSYFFVRAILWPQANVPQNYRKAQYIDLSSYPSIMEFRRIMERSRMLVVEEMLPSNDHYGHSIYQGHAVELVLELSRHGEINE